MLHCKRPVFYLGWAIIIASLTACANSPIGKNWEQSLAPDPQLTDNPTVFGAKQVSAQQKQPTKLTTKLPADFPQDIPLYSNAKLQGVTSVKGKDNQVSTRWLSADPSNIITSFYTEQLQKNNWKLIKTQKPSGDFQSILSARRNNLQVNISIQPQQVTSAVANQPKAATEILIAYLPVTSTSKIKGNNIPKPGDGEFIGPLPQKQSTQQTISKSTPTNQSQPIGDVNQVTKQLSGYIQDLAALGVFGGEFNRAKSNSSNTEEQFQPNKIITRREYARWLVAVNNAMYADKPAKQIRLASASDRPVFKDVSSNDPDFTTIQGLAEAGLISSSLSGETTNVLFRPDAPLTREKLLLWKIPLDTRQALPTANINAVQQTWGFQDVGKIAPKVLRALLADHQNGDKSNVRRVFGYTTLFQPKKPVTRGEAAVALWYFGTEGEGISAVEALKLNK
ncbi:S-layer homology domain-containing protein [Calothrix rhizosoleniae]|uniref:S-layer homology domain-containing protein n=1 Tax=Calothrix rhizosoleniae TaxID=888997 RepID=UPI000B4A0A6E|nr:S-layer homology domain-containing protein [Calothrix rhizosoleniae]